MSEAGRRRDGMMSVWKVVGGAAKGGIIVRESAELRSPQVPACLATGSVVEELNLVGERLHYGLLSGTGPPTGWVSVRTGDRELLVLQGKSCAVRERPYMVVHSRVAVRNTPSSSGKIRASLRRGDKVFGTPFKVDAVPWLLVSPKNLRRLLPRTQLDTGDEENAWVLMDATTTDLGLGALLLPLQGEERLPAGTRAEGEVDFKVCGLGGELCRVTADCQCPLRDLKVAIEAVTGIPGREQRLFSGSAELNNVASLQRFADCGGSTELTLVRRHAQQAVWIEKVDKDWRCLAEAPSEVKGDREVVLAAVKQKGAMLKHATPELQADRELVLVAVGQDGHALRHAAEAVQGDAQVVLSAVQHSGCAIKHAAPDLQADRKLALAAVRQDWRALHFAGPTCQTDPEVVLEALRQDQGALDIVAEDAWAERQVMLTAVEISGHAVTCPRWHPLRRLTTRYTDVECNECELPIGSDSNLCCRRCDYDICDRCAELLGKALLEGMEFG